MIFCEAGKLFVENADDKAVKVPYAGKLLKTVPTSFFLWKCSVVFTNFPVYAQKDGVKKRHLLSTQQKIPVYIFLPVQFRESLLSRLFGSPDGACERLF
jgi:hypothetical protein